MNIDYALSQLSVISTNLDLLGLKQISAEIDKFVVWMFTQPHKNEDSKLPPSLTSINDNIECICSAVPEAYTFNIPSLNALVAKQYLCKALAWFSDIYTDSTDIHIQKSIYSYIEVINYIITFVS